MYAVERLGLEFGTVEGAVGNGCFLRVFGPSWHLVMQGDLRIAVAPGGVVLVQ